MVELEGVTVEDLREALATVDAKTPALRLVVALNFKHGHTQTAIAEQYGIARKTVYNWLVRFEGRTIEDAIYDDERSGRPAKLTEAQQRSLEELLRRPPDSVGYGAQAWTPTLTQQLVEDIFQIEYSIPHIRRLMRNSGLESTKGGWKPDE